MDKTKIPTEFVDILSDITGKLLKFFEEYSVKKNHNAGEMIFDIMQALATISSAIGYRLMETQVPKEEHKNFSKMWLLTLMKFTDINLKHLISFKDKPIH